MFRARGNRHNYDQKQFLVDFMEANPAFAFGRYAGPRHKAQALWEELTREINLRGPKKSIAQWQKAWTDVKSRARVRVSSKYNLPGFDPATDLDARVLALQDSLVEAPPNRTDYLENDSDMNEMPETTNQPDFLSSLEVDVDPPEMVLLPDAEPDNEHNDTCSIPDVKDVLGNNGPEDQHPVGQTSSYNSVDIGENFDDTGEFDESFDNSQNYDGNSSHYTKESEENHQQRPVQNFTRRWKRLPNKNFRPAYLPSVSCIQRRQTETLEAISKAMTLNAENEKERNKLMLKSIEVNEARLKAEQERNGLLRDLVSALKGMSNDKTEQLR